MTYPITIIDNFFEDPDKIVNLAKTFDYYPSNGDWPGVRTDQLHLVDNRLFNYIGEKIYLLFYEESPVQWSMITSFQKIKPFSEDQYDRRNKGWVHQDIDILFAGIVYLNKDPEPDTGTSIYTTKNGYALQYRKELEMKENLYLGNDIDLDDYNRTYDAVHDQYIESVRVENVYNRLLLFNNQTHHGVHTFGTKERITLNCFGSSVTGKIPPILRGY